MKIRIIKKYPDKEERQVFNVGDERDVSDKRADVLIRAGVAESMDGRTQNNPVSESVDTRTPSRGRRAGGYDDATE